MDRKFRLLRADEIECRVSTVKEGKGLSLLLYKNARCDMNILDETVGPMNWQRDMKELKGTIYAGVALKKVVNGIETEWVWKWDCGTESKTDAQKGESSDAFKRACFNWGLGRELYTAPFIWIPENKLKDKYDRFSVTDIGYDSNGVINYLVIYNQTTKEKVFTMGSIPGYPSRDEMLECARKHYPGTKMNPLLETFGITKIEDASNEQLAAVYNKYAK